VVSMLSTGVIDDGYRFQSPGRDAFVALAVLRLLPGRQSDIADREDIAEADQDG
jgi:hypothetical protein